MRTFSEIIDAFGVARLAEVLGLSESHIRVMKTRDSIAPEHWGEIVKHRPMPELEDLTLEDLHELRLSRFKNGKEHSQHEAAAE